MTRSQFILGGLNCYVLTVYIEHYFTTNVLIVVILYFKTLLLLLRWNTGKDRFGGMARFKSGFRCKGCINSVILNVITEINYRRNYIDIFKYISTM